MAAIDNTLGTALLLSSIGLLMAGLGVFFVGFAQFIKADHEHKGFFRKG